LPVKGLSMSGHEIDKIVEELKRDKNALVIQNAELARKKSQYEHENRFLREELEKEKTKNNLMMNKLSGLIETIVDQAKYRISHYGLENPKPLLDLIEELRPLRVQSRP